MATTATTLSTGTTNLALAGLASGFDWQSLISQLVTVEREPETQLQTQQATLQQKNSALGTIKTQLTSLQSDLTNLSSASFFDTRTATPSDSTLATATAGSGTALGTYGFEVDQLATSAVLQGTAGAGGALSPTDDVSNLVLSAAGFSTPVTAGTFTVNGAQVTIATSDTLQSVFDKISSATSGAVTASYSAASDKITLSSTGAIVLGSATDTSNFLQAAKLSNNGTGTVTSSAKLGAALLGGPISQSNLATAVTGDASGNGSFTINGVTINYNINSDSLSNVLTRINDSGAGVVAAYDPVNNRFTLTNSTTGDVGIGVQDVSGNFLAATGLSPGTLARGNDLLYKVNGGPQLSNQSNTLDATNAGIPGLSVTALGKGSFTVTVGADTNTIRSAITQFINDYNTVESTISAQTVTTTDSTGAVTAGTLTGDMQVETLADQLRSVLTSAVSHLGGRVNLDSLGFTSSGQTNLLSTTDLSGLDSALTGNLGGLKDLFSNATTGLGAQLNTFLTNSIGGNGSVVTEQTNLTTQYNDINTQISHLETQVQAYQQQLTNEFVAMETAESQTNQEMSYLTKAFSSSSS